MWSFFVNVMWISFFPHPSHNAALSFSFNTGWCTDCELRMSCVRVPMLPSALVSAGMRMSCMYDCRVQSMPLLPNMSLLLWFSFWCLLLKPQALVSCLCYHSHSFPSCPAICSIALNMHIYVFSPFKREMWWRWQSFKTNGHNLDSQLKNKTDGGDAIFTAQLLGIFFFFFKCVQCLRPLMLVFFFKDRSIIRKLTYNDKNIISDLQRAARRRASCQLANRGAEMWIHFRYFSASGSGSIMPSLGPGKQWRSYKCQASVLVQS